MAQLIKTVLGRVSGAVGDIVFREMDGKNYIRLRPSSFMPGTDQAAVNRRARFALTQQSCSSIYSISQFKFLWGEVTPSDMATHNYLVKTNYRYVTPSDLTSLLQLVPENGFSINVSDSNVDNTVVHVVIDAIRSNAGINPALEPKIMMAGIIFLSSPLDASVGAYSILSLASPQQNTNLDNPLTFDAALTNQQQAVFNKYQVQKTFVALVTLDAANQPVHYSSTVLLT